ncbi:hypothetical protein DUNSADRAFT_8279 [Dunaliella salina]|uniref:Kinesin motor domain-containing protein n=1 Tax=Dunaliella salina TaxID=3046 RepID=A0ABQ7HA81_DUNSA|nr:hypothetical protein DUNSADRAFT_8279 [Dunaliella salina]|eukprot:KAF5843763.1 hypothetical protein DUNSADRAFT_8279 [Dunaliella salina]
MNKFLDLISFENEVQLNAVDGGNTCNLTAKEVSVESPEQLQEILDNAECVRKTSKTHMNTESSRSHACLMVTIEQTWNGGVARESGQFEVGADLKPPTPVRMPSNNKDMYTSPLQGSEGPEGSPPCVIQSTLFLVDLAGSERVGKTGAVGEAAKEGTKINESLLNLRGIITTLRAGKRPGKGVYRRYKITRLLQDCLGGNSNVLFIGCVTPSRFCDPDTKSTLQYAMEVAGIASTVVVNKKRFPVTTQASKIIRALQRDVALQKSQLEVLEKQLEASHQVHAADEDKTKKLETVILVQRIELEARDRRWESELQRTLQQEVEAGQQTAPEAEAQHKAMQTSISGLEAEKQALEDQLDSSRAAVSALESEKQELQSKVQHAQRAEAAAMAAAQEAKQQVARLEEEAEEGMHREVRVKQQLEKVQVELEDSRRGAEQQQRHAEQQAELARLSEEEAARQQQGLQEQLQEQQNAAEEQQQLHAADTARLEQLQVQERAAKEQLQLHAVECARLEEQVREQQQAAAAAQAVKAREVQMLLAKAEEAQQRVRAAEQTARQQEGELNQLRQQHEEQQRLAQQRKEQMQGAQQCMQEVQRAAEEQQWQHAADCARFKKQLKEQQHTAEEQRQQHAADCARLERQLSEQQRAAEEQQRQHATDSARLEQQLSRQQHAEEEVCKQAVEEQQRQHAADCARLKEQIKEQQQVAAAAQTAAAEVQQQLCAARKQLEASTLTMAAELDAAKAIAQQMCESKEQQRAALEVQLEEQGTALTQLQAVHASTQVQHERKLANWEARLQDVQDAHASNQEQHERELANWEARLQTIQAAHASMQEQHKRELANWAARLQDMEDVHAATQEQHERELANWESRLQTVQAVHATTQQREIELTDWATRLQAVKAEQAEAAQRAEKRLQAVEGELQSVQVERAQLQQALQAASHEAGEAANSMRQQLDSALDEHQVLKQQLSAKVQELGVAKQQLESSVQELKVSNEELGVVKLQLESRAQELGASNVELCEVKQQMVTKQQELEVSIEELGTIKQQLESKAQELEASKEELGMVKQQQQQQQQLQQEHEQQHVPDLGARDAAVIGTEEGQSSDGQAVGSGDDGSGAEVEEGEESNWSPGSEDGSDEDSDDVSLELDQHPSPTRWMGPKGVHPTDLSQVRLAVRCSKRSSDGYVLLDREGNLPIESEAPSHGGGKGMGVMHGRYIPAGEPGQIPAEKLEGVLGNLQGKWLQLPSHGLQGLPETLLVRASVYNHGRNGKLPQRSAGTSDFAKACFAALEVGGSASVELYGKPARLEFQKLGMVDRYQHQGSQLDVALVYPVPGCFCVTRLNVNHLDPESTVDLCVGDKRLVEVQPRALIQQALARLQESSPAYESQQVGRCKVCTCVCSQTLVGGS